MAFVPALAAAAAVLQGVSAFGQANYQRQVARNNQTIATQNANRASDSAQVAQLRSDREYAQVVGQQLAAQSASGFDVLGASQVGVRALTAKVRGEAATDIRRKGESDTAGYFNQAAGFAGEANAAKARGISALLATPLNAAGAYVGASKDGGVPTSIIGGAKSRQKNKFGK